MPPTPIEAVNDAQTTPWDTNQTYRPLVNDSASGGASIVASTLRLCPTSVSAPFTRAKCTATSVTVPGEGVYTLSGSTVLFDPEPTFSGTVSTPVRYVYGDSAGQSASAKITPTIGEPVGIEAVNDAQTTPWDTNQTYRPLVNDSASGGASIVASTLRLCPTSVSAPFTRAKCTATSVTVPGEGVYTLSGSTVLFDPEPTFSGTVSTPVRYVYGDSAGQSASAKITPTIGERAVDDDQYTPWDTNQTYEPLDNDSPNHGATIVKSSLRLCSTSIAEPLSILNCNLMQVVVPGEGVYRVVRFSVVFDPEPTFFGTVKTPVHYVYADTAGESATAMITPTIGNVLPVTGATPIFRFAISLMLLALSVPALMVRRRRHG